MAPETKVVKAAKPVLEWHNKQDSTSAYYTLIATCSCILNGICNICWESHPSDVSHDSTIKAGAPSGKQSSMLRVIFLKLYGSSSTSSNFLFSSSFRCTSQFDDSQIGCYYTVICQNVQMSFYPNAYRAQDTPTIQNAIAAELHFTKYLLKLLQGGEYGEHHTPQSGRGVKDIYSQWAYVYMVESQYTMKANEC